MVHSWTTFESNFQDFFEAVGKKKKTFHTFRMKMKGSCEVGYWEENGGAQR